MAETDTVGFGSATVAALQAAIDGAKALDPLAPVTVVPPTNFAGLWLRRRLSREGGLANVRFMSLARLAEFLGATGVESPRSRPRTPAVAAEAVRQVLAADPGMFERVAAHPSTAESLVASFQELDEVAPGDLAALAAPGGRAAEIVRLYGEFRRSTAAYYSRPELFLAAVRATERGAGIFRDIGHVVVYLPGRLAPSRAALVDALVRSRRGQVINASPVGAPVAGRILTTTDIDEEVRTVVSLILADLEQGCAADQIACYYPIEEIYQPLLTEQLRAAGVPFNAPGGTPLASTPPGRALLGLLALDPGSISRAALVGWLSAAPIRDGSRAVPLRTWSRISRDAGVAGGPPERWDVALGSYRQDQERRLLQARHDGRDGQADAIDRSLDSASQLGQFVAELAESLVPPAAPGWRAWTVWARSLLLHYLDQRDLQPPEVAIVDAVVAGLDDLAALDDLGGPAAVDPGAFQQAARQMLSRGTPPEFPFGHGVLVAPLRLAAGIGMESTYVLGAVEGVLPSTLREDPLLSDRDRARVPSLPLSRTRLDDLRKAYISALAETTASTLSYPVGNLRRGRAQLPSRWLLESASAHVGRRIDSEEFSRLHSEPWLLRSPSLSARLMDAHLPLIDDSEYELAAMRRSGPAAAIRESVTLGMEALREHHSPGLSRFDGNLAGLVSALGDSVASPTRLETYARCPFRYYLSSILRVAEFEEPEEVRSLSALDRGTIVHDTLDQFYKENAGRPPGPWSRADRERITAIALEHCARFEQLGRTGGPALWNIERSRLIADLVDYLDADAIRSEQLGTRFYGGEIAFGEPGGWPAVAIPTGAGAVLFRGRIDRVDSAADGEYWVYDYKTGSAYGLNKLERDPIAAGTRLQLPVYAEAVRAALGATAVRSGYWMVSDANDFGVRELPMGEATRAALVLALQHIAGGIGGGVYIANPGKDGENCRYCPYDGICPADRGRAYERKIADPVAEPYRTLVEAPK